jgi:hypothetical protein
MAKNKETNDFDMNDKIKGLLFKQVERPKNLYDVKIVNVFENRYRINVWTTVEEDSLTKRKIHASYFAHLNNDELSITSGI